MIQKLDYHVPFATPFLSFQHVTFAFCVKMISSGGGRRRIWPREGERRFRGTTHTDTGTRPGQGALGAGKGADDDDRRTTAINFSVGPAVRLGS